jgi:hypothetical protein
VLVLGLDLSYLAFWPDSLGVKAHHDLFTRLPHLPKNTLLEKEEEESASSSAP